MSNAMCVGCAGTRQGVCDMTEGERAAEPESATVANRLDGFRRRIDELDEQIVRLVNLRAECAHQIGQLKESIGMETYQPKREEDVLAHVRDVNTGPLGADAIKRVFEKVIDESRRLEKLTSGGK